MSRSTSVSWITACVQWRFRCSSPPKAFFIAPVMRGEDVRLDGGQLDHVHPHQRLGDEDPVRIDLIEDEQLVALGDVFEPLEIFFVEVEAGDVVLVGHEAVLVVGSQPGWCRRRRCRCARPPGRCSRPICSARMTPSICQGVDEQAGYQVCQEMLILSPVWGPFGSAASKPASFITWPKSSTTVSGVVFRTATLPLPANECMHASRFSPTFYRTCRSR